MVQINELSADVIEAAVKRVMTTLAAGETTTGQGPISSTPSSGSKLNAKSDFPLSKKRPDLVKSRTGMAFNDITLEKVINGEVGFDDVRIRPETLEYQAQIAESGGRPHIASNLRRAAEMTRIPDDRVLEMYVALRPYRSTKAEMLAIAEELENKYDAKVCAKFVREAAEVYEKRKRLKGQ